MKRKAEWTLVVAAIAGVLNWVAGFQLDFLSVDQAAAWIVVINAAAAVVAAWKTRPIGPQVFTYAIASAAALVAAYGFQVDQAQVATFTNAALAVLALLTRGQVSPKDDMPARAAEQNRPVA